MAYLGGLGLKAGECGSSRQRIPGFQTQIGEGIREAATSTRGRNATYAQLVYTAIIIAYLYSKHRTISEYRISNGKNGKLVRSGANILHILIEPSIDDTKAKVIPV